MGESFIRASKIKADIEKQISELDSSKIYHISHKQNEFMNLYQQARDTLEENSQRIQTQIQQLSKMIESIQITISNDFNLSNESKQIQKRKAQNIEGQIKELTSFLRRTSTKKIDFLKQEKDKYQLYGTGRNSEVFHNTQLENSQRITSNTRLTNEMLGSGREILHSFQQQSNTLKGVQKKVLNIINELGISSQFVKAISSRSRSDNIIICVLFLVLIIFIAICYYVIRPMVKGS